MMNWESEDIECRRFVMESAERFKECSVDERERDCAGKIRSDSVNGRAIVENISI